MLILNPRSVVFGGSRWEGVVSVAIDRLPQRLVEEWSDEGPFAVLVDVPEERTRIKVVQEILRDDLDAPRPGEQGTLSLCTSPAASDAGRRRLSASAVVLRVEHEVSVKTGAVRTVTLAAVSADGAADPVSVGDAGAAP
jgi:hypothetical protein